MDADNLVFILFLDVSLQAFCLHQNTIKGSQILSVALTAWKKKITF